MDLPKKAILEFQKLYIQEHGVKLSFEEAREIPSNLLGLYKTVTSKDDVKA